MGKLRIYPTYNEGMRAAIVSVPTTQKYLDQNVFEDLNDAAEDIGYIRLEGESTREPRFFELLKVTFKTMADLMRFKAYIQENYES